MNCNKIEEISIQYFERELSNQDISRLHRHIQSCSSCLKVYNELSLLYEYLENPTQFEPETSLQSNFEKFLEKEKRNIERPGVTLPVFPQKYLYTALKYAAILILGLVLGWIINATRGKTEIAELKNEMQETKNMVVLALLQNESASERIKAVSYSHELERNNEIIQALIHTMNFDSNVSVRLAAINALYKFNDQAQVREAFIKTLKAQNDPRIQIRLIDILVEMEENKVIPDFYKMLEKNNLNKVVKYKLEEGIGTLL